MSESRYLSAHPATRTPEPRGRIVVHNHIRPDDFTPDYPLGDNGFRAWSCPRGDSRPRGLPMRMGSLAGQALPRALAPR
jgi:hypothetical protein